MTQSASGLDARRTFGVFLVCLVAALWLLARPYIGLRHDGELYLAQMLRHWYPDVMSGDLFFKFGSQDSYSVVSWLLASLYEHIGVAYGQMLIIAATQAAVLVCVYRLLMRAGVTRDEAVLGIAAICVMSHNYGGWNILSFSERFVTGRTFAEPFALFGLVAIDRKWLLRGAVALLVSMLFHPLIAAPVMVMAWALLVVRDRRWLWCLLAAPVAIGLGAAGISPFSALLERYDPEWWKHVLKANGMVFIAKWPLADWLAVLFDCSLLWVGGRIFPSLRHMLRVVAVVTGALLATSILGADLLQNVLITQLQLWRVHWISHLLALPLLPVLLWRLWRPSDVLAQTAVFAVAAAAVATNVRYTPEPAFIAWAVFTLWLWRAQPAVSPKLLRVMRIASAAALVGVSALVLKETAKQLFTARGEVNFSYILLLLVTMPAISLPFVWRLLKLQGRGGVQALSALTLAVAGVVFGAMTWDQRGPWIRYIETHVRDEHPWEKIIPANAEVLWWDQAPAVWAVLHRRSYHSILQSGGLLFNRDTALEFHRRSGAVGAIQLQRDVCDFMSNLSPEKVHADCWPTYAAVEQVCQAKDGADFVILPRPLEQGVVSTWKFQESPDSATTFYLHDCKQIR